jgi:hypothetical protein
MAERGSAYRVFVRHSEGIKPLRRTRRNGITKFEWIITKTVRWAWTGLIWLRIRTSGGLL